MRTAKDIMSTDVVFLRSDDSIFDAAKLFSELNIHGIPVVENEELVGMITVTDVIRFIGIRIDKLVDIPIPRFKGIFAFLLRNMVSHQKFRKELERIASLKVRDIMTKEVVSVLPSTNFVKIARIMDEMNIHRVPVVMNKKLVGIVTGSDLMKVVSEGYKDSLKESA